MPQRGILTLLHFPLEINQFKTGFPLCLMTENHPKVFIVQSDQPKSVLADPLCILNTQMILKTKNTFILMMQLYIPLYWSYAGAAARVGWCNIPPAPHLGPSLRLKNFFQPFSVHLIFNSFKPTLVTVLKSDPLPHQGLLLYL